MPGMTSAENQRWRERVKKEDFVLNNSKPNPYRLNPNTVHSFPVDPPKLDPRLAQKDQTEETFNRYDVNGDGWMDVKELKNILRDLQIFLSDANIHKLQAEMDMNGDGRVSIVEATTWWKGKQDSMAKLLFTDPTDKWGKSPATTSREVGWFVARRADTSIVRRNHQQKWRVPKQSCAETLYSTEFVKFAGTSPYSNKSRAENTAK
mmetsp:Transcript_30411/g.35887  ORF Transcript_30411/g.35887 Transcript_30411/m.35887 type:complete len:206 (-) Transcript_30411:148-765(-)|eukprot:CAMPEP_0114355006 /NCGR_PEP_ID=MMETSP0101-20121206/19892_1 /TAXON_ID=38822 ORGANISM="Pteridomonas danica, Strain PT" /NCGR_SAMPLE_ID=MMETSP0101 /ASSEMBLY_ACC=CAM_ASM_000211 /LENGTH=205 /DNA_ID=CAMNT_0001496731 /DNA_START=63 /DNA_END=680 /DNA_ORIENTATION=-